MNYEQQLKAELKARFNPEKGEGLRTVDTHTLDLMWKLYQIDKPDHSHKINRSVWEEGVLENFSVMGIFKV